MPEVTQRDLLEQNTTLTKLVYEAVGQLSDRVARIEGRLEGTREQDQKQNSRSSLWVYRAGLASSSSLSVVAILVSILRHG